MPRLKLLEMDIDNKMIYFRKEDKLIAFDADAAIELISDSLDGKNESVKHGHWELVRNPMMYQTVPYVQVCSQCGTAFPYKMPYCGECGAMMDEVRDE